MKRLSLLLIILICNFHNLSGQNKGLEDSSILHINKDMMASSMNSCYVCHNPNIKSHTDIIAPPLVAIKYIYKLRYPDRSQFIEKMVDFVLSPNNQKGIMQGPIMRFGVMPELPLDSATVRQVTAFIYDNEIIEPDWFPEYFESRHGIKWDSQ